MHSQKGRIPRKLLHTAVMICAAVLCFASIEPASAKYISQSHANDRASVAQFSPSLIFDNNIIDISDIKKPGDSADKTFTVQNFSGDSVSEVTMKYKIILKTTGNLPLHYTVLDNEKNILADWNCDGIGGNQRYEYENSSLIFTPGVEGIHKYILKVEWSSSQNAAQFAGMTDAVYLSVIWEQVD